MAASNVVRLPTAARRKIRVPFLNGKELAARGIRRILPEAEPSKLIDPRDSFTYDMIIAAAILEQLSLEQKMAAQNSVHRLFCETGSAHARAASAFMMSLR